MERTIIKQSIQDAADRLLNLIYSDSIYCICCGNIIKSSLLYSKYAVNVDNMSAYEHLVAERAKDAEAKAAEAQAAAEAKESEKAEKEAAKEQAKADKARERAIKSVGNSVLGTIGRELGKSIGGKTGSKFGKTLGGNTGASLARGLFGTLFKK